MNTKKVFELIEEIESNLNTLKEELEVDSLYEYEEVTPFVDDDVEYYDPSEEI